ncbi:Outer membrane protein beta-barrel domain-containing protein [Flavobacterium glycines]|uniref:Outer membrane protein beta-barrel domain-containing protein n=1 Tax=Flavobacterium glycines TaxID=551990 RepID=A0A1B9DSD4_9FLAO|nr:outer membrane beta-barrel protein [Flavobacterium glycines]OCB72594.1 hypothetical protein FBGL_08120 [Flavobacterium glycines]GEL10091.1 hypothetical protein FGL01_08300 [Flavobacterium glycines]SDI81817.1 Outer membrane protein beta-barrel domain-containing protein [Flavobacterium glycines]
MRKILIGFLFLFSVSVFSQDLKYGLVVGANAYDIEMKGSLFVGSGKSPFNVGGFVDYKIKNHLGLKAHLIYNTTEEGSYYYEDNGARLLFEYTKLKTLQLHTLLKYDVKEDYSKGFYLLGGFRMTGILDAKSNENVDLGNFYNKVNLGCMFGIGTTFLKNFSIELVGDRSFTNTVDFDKNKSKNWGAYANILFNLEPLFNHSN